MKKLFLFILLYSVWATGFSQSLSLTRLGDSFQCTNLAIHWDAPSNAYPHSVWIYEVVPKKFPPEAISALVQECGFTEKDKKVSTAAETVYKNADRFPSKHLEVSNGSIFYIYVPHYGPTNFASDVPEMDQMPQLATNFISKLGVEAGDIEKKPDGTPNFHFWQPFKEYFLPDGIVTNIEFRAVGFSRAVDGATILGAGTAGDGEIFFGPHSKPVHIDISWRGLDRVKQANTVSPETIMEWIRHGKAVQGGIPMNLPPINWQSVRNLTVKSADLCFYAGDRIAPSKWLMPLLSLWTTVDTGNGNIEVEIDCPVIDEPAP